ncbi:hypothetical protein LEMLEM_LOCUS3899 [Lemmus lemmus]
MDLAPFPCWNSYICNPGESRKCWQLANPRTDSISPRVEDMAGAGETSSWFSVSDAGV